VRTGSASVPSPAPSKVVIPIVTSTRATDPGTSATHFVAADNARRTPSVRSRASSGARVENMPKYTENPSPRASHLSVPNRAMATHV